ncbi:MAG TPA: hypothetical protein DDZ51_19740 [Planctomycetaceae bacterium]|nr:hypothetical protein [Planctomycetaceae bacterium]
MRSHAALNSDTAGNVAEKLAAAEVYSNDRFVDGRFLASASMEMARRFMVLGFRLRAVVTDRRSGQRQ